MCTTWFRRLNYLHVHHLVPKVELSPCAPLDPEGWGIYEQSKCRYNCQSAVCVYIYIHTHTHPHTHAHRHTRARARARTHTHTPSQQDLCENLQCFGSQLVYRSCFNRHAFIEIEMRPDIRKRKQRKDGESCLMTSFCFLNLMPNIKVIQWKKIRDGRGLQNAGRCT